MPESGRKSKPTVAERVGKHRLENKLKTELTMMKQQMKRSQLLASGTPEAEKMRKEAAERKRRQRMREKEEKAEENVVRRMSADRGMEMPGNSYSPHNHHCHGHSLGGHYCHCLDHTFAIITLSLSSS